MKYEKHNTERLSEILVEDTYYDVLFLGSSRTHLSVNPKVIDSICFVKSYNLGIEGGDMYEFEMLLKAFLVHHPPPKFIVLDFDMHTFTGEQKIYNYPIYFPFIYKNEIIKDYLFENNYFKTLYKYFPFLAFTDFDDNTKGYFLKGLIGKDEIPPNDFQFNGYLSNTNVEIIDTTFNFSKKSLSLSNLKISCLNNLVNLCKQKGIHLIFKYPPEFRKLYQKSVLNRNQIFSIILKESKKNNILFLRDDNLALSSDPTYFANITHLNIQGAYVYSTYLGNLLNSITKINLTLK